MFAKNGYADLRGGGECGPREALFLRLWVNYDNTGIEESKAKHEGHRSEEKIKMCSVRPAPVSEHAGRWRGHCTPRESAGEMTERRAGVMVQPRATSLVGVPTP